jgi:hypothetical protein
MTRKRRRDGTVLEQRRKTAVDHLSKYQSQSQSQSQIYLTTIAKLSIT